MCLLIIEIVLLITGIIALVTGKFPLSKGVVLQGTKARIAGGILALELPLAFALGLLLGTLIGFGILPSDVAKYSACIDIGLIVVCVAGSFGYAYANKPPAPPPQVPPPPQPPAVPPTQ